MASEKLVQLLEKLRQATAEGRVRWSASSSEGSYRVSLGSADLEIERETPSATAFMSRNLASKNYTYVVYIKKPGGSTEALDVEFFDPIDANYDLAKELYFHASRDVLGLDKIIDSMIENVTLS